VDVAVLVGAATASQRRRMFLRFFPAEAARADRFAAELEGRAASAAELQVISCPARPHAHAGRGQVAVLGGRKARPMLDAEGDDRGRFRELGCREMARRVFFDDKG
jgi:hypothetical protein